MDKPDTPDAAKTPDVPAPPRSLRYGVLANSARLQRWQRLMLEELGRVAGVELALAVTNAEAGATTRAKRLRMLHPATLLYQWHSRREGPPRMLEQADCSDLFAAARLMSCQAERRGKWSNYFRAEDVASIKEMKLDFLLRFGFNIIRGPILKAARYGAWSCHFMDEQKYRGQPPCYWECYYGDSEAAGMLQQLTSRLDGGIKLKQVRVDLTRGSIRENIDSLYGALAPAAAEVCRDILAGRAGYFADPPVTTSAPVLTTPGNLAMLRIMRNEQARLAAQRG